MTAHNPTSATSDRAPRLSEAMQWAEENLLYRRNIVIRFEGVTETAVLQVKTDHFYIDDEEQDTTSA